MGTIVRDGGYQNRREWMLFIDGENLAIRARKYAESRGLCIPDGPNARKDVFVWFNGGHPLAPRFSAYERPGQLATRGYYYTSLVGDEQVLASVRRDLWEMGFSPQVFKRDANLHKAKGVDIALTTDMLSHAFRGNYEIAVLVAGDGDYVPLVEEVKRLGKLVWVWFLADEKYGLNPALKLAADHFMDMTNEFLQGMTAPLATP
jgi:hypothetical protein